MLALSATLGLGCGSGDGDPTPTGFDTFMSLAVGNVWIYEEHSRWSCGLLTGTQCTPSTWTGRASITVVAVDEATGVATLELSSARRCASRSVFVRHDAMGALEASTDGSTWLVLLDATGTPTSNAGALMHLLRSDGATIPAPTTGAVVEDGLSVTVLAGSFDDAVRVGTEPGVGAAWSRSVGLLQSSAGGTSHGTGGYDSYELVAYDVVRNDGTRLRNGDAVAGLPVAPSSLVVRRTTAGEASVHVEGCSLFGVTFPVERRCTLDAAFVPLLVIANAEEDAVDPNAPMTACEYQVAATNAQGTSLHVSFSMGAATAPLTPEMPAVSEKVYLEPFRTAVHLTAVASSAGGVATGTVSWFDTEWHALPDPVSLTDGVFAVDLFYEPDGTVVTTPSTSTSSWPPGTYRFRVVAHGTDADSALSAEATLEL